MRVLTWNLKHGRSVPGAGRDLFEEFAAALAAWEWDVALLQEVPPWWPPGLAERTAASERHVLTSRNWGLAARRFVAVRWPDAIKSNGGGANAILVRGDVAPLDHRRKRLSLLPERRWVHAVRLGGTWVANVHLQASPGQAVRAASAVLTWAGSAPAVIGGDFNLRSPSLPGFVHAGGHHVDHVLARDLRPDGEAVTLDRGRLSDHAPVVVKLRPAPPAAAGRVPRSPAEPRPPTRP